MSYFNADREAHMDFIATIPAEERCYCGWYDADHVTTYRLGKCSHCLKGKTCADKLREQAALTSGDGSESADWKFRFEELSAEFAILSRACGNWRTWPNEAESDHDHPDWKVAAKAILTLRSESAGLREGLLAKCYELDSRAKAFEDNNQYYFRGVGEGFATAAKEFRALASLAPAIERVKHGYEVGGIWYCGWCHQVLPAPATSRPPTQGSAVREAMEAKWESYIKSEWPDRKEEWSHHWRDVAIDFALAQTPSASPGSERE